MVIVVRRWLDLSRFVDTTTKQFADCNNCFSGSSVRTVRSRYLRLLWMPLRRLYQQATVQLVGRLRLWRLRWNNRCWWDQWRVKIRCSRYIERHGSVALVVQSSKLSLSCPLRSTIGVREAPRSMALQIRMTEISIIVFYLLQTLHTDNFVGVCSTSTEHFISAYITDGWSDKAGKAVLLCWFSRINFPIYFTRH